MKKIRLLYLVILALCVTLLGCDCKGKEEKFYLPTEAEITAALGDNYSMKLEHISKVDTFQTDYVVTSEGYYGSYKSYLTETTVLDSFAYLYLKDANELYFGTEKWLTVRLPEEEGFGNGMDYLAYFAGMEAVKLQDATVEGRECVKYQIITESDYEFVCYIDNQTKACIRCVANSTSSSYEWTIGDLKIGGQSLEEYKSLIKIGENK